MRLGMDRTEDARLAVALDAGLDALDGIAAPADDSDELGALLTTARHVQLADAGASVRNGRVPGGWPEIVRQAEIPTAVRPRIRSGRGWSWGVPRFGELATGAVILALLVAGVFGTGLIERGRRQGAASGEARAIYLASDETGWLSPIDPMTLEDRPGTFPTVSGTPDAAPNRDPHPERSWSASPDGSTIASVTHSGNLSTITVYDAGSGKQRSRFSEAVSSNPVAFNHDGSLLVLASHQQLDATGTIRKQAELLVYETATGRLAKRIVATGVTLAPAYGPLLDPTGERIYVLALAEDWATAPSSQSDLRVLAFSVATGALAGEVAVTLTDLGLRLGSSGPSPDRDVTMRLVPGWTLSSDGAILAVVDGFAGIVWSIDTERMTPARFEVTTTEASPQVEATTGCDADTRFTPAAFAGTTHRLVVGGLASGCISPTEFQYRSLGLIELDLDTGARRSAAAAIGGLIILPRQPDPENIYALKIDYPEEPRIWSSADVDVVEPLDIFLVRIGARSLEVEAERKMDTGSSGVVIVSGNP